MSRLFAQIDKSFCHKFCIIMSSSTLFFIKFFARTIAAWSLQQCRNGGSRGGRYLLRFFLEAIFAPLASMEKVFKAVYYVTAHNNNSSKNNNKQKLAATKEKSISAAAKKIYFWLFFFCCCCCCRHCCCCCCCATKNFDADDEDVKFEW